MLVVILDVAQRSRLLNIRVDGKTVCVTNAEHEYLCLRLIAEHPNMVE